MSDVDEGFSDLYPPLERSVLSHVDRQSASVVQIESGKLVPVALALVCVAIGIAGIGLGLSIGAQATAARAEREARLQRLETDELKAAVLRAGIPVHAETDSP